MIEEKNILDFMKSKEYIPMKAKELASIFDIHKNEIDELKNILKKLENEGKIKKNKRNRYSINEVITLVGTFKNSKSFGFVIPDNKKESKDIFISKKNFNGAKDNTKVVVQITKEAQSNKKPEGKIIEVIGKVDEAGVDLLSIVKEYNLPNEFPKQVIDEAKQVSNEIDLKETEKRKDFRKDIVFTIDGEDAKDLDDAVSIEKTSQETFLLNVHIADVSYYVKEDSFLDKEAILRGTSVYMLNRVIPMLPKELSNGICSLNEGQDRLTLSVLMEIDKNGDVISSDITKGIIKVTKRMSYTGVQALLDHIENPKQQNKLIKEYIPYEKQLKLMAELAQILENKRKKQGYLDLDIPESKITLNKSGHTINVEKYEVKFANTIIEQFMLTANEVVAEKFYWLEAPFIYRVHESPDQEKITELNRFLYNFGYKIKGKTENIHPKVFSDILEDIKGKEDMVISNLILRTLKVARYEAQNKGHFGIASKYYCHFTSPIRRYPDLYIHRIISNYINNSYNVSEEYKEKENEQAVKYAESSSEREKIAQKAERDSIDLKKAEYMQDKIGEKYEGIISSVTNFGVFVQLENTIEGLIRFENLGNEYFEYDDMHKILIGEQTKKVYKMGDKVKIQVIEANKTLRRVGFAICK